jgi:glycosyltransferase involved in cell wall biosynthesis
VDKAAVKNADIVLVNSEYTKKRIRKIYDISPIVIYPPVSNEFRPMNNNKARNILKKFNINKKFVLLHGRMIKDKRPDWAIRAFSKTKDIDMVISGTIEEEKNIEKLISDLDLNERVKIIGRVSEKELIALYNLAECFIMSAPKEDFGLTSVEAMACGCPVVAWNDGAGPNETILDGITGKLVRPYDLNHFTDAIEQIIKKNMKKYNKKKIVKSVNRFKEDVISKKLIETIKNI